MMSEKLETKAVVMFTAGFFLCASLVSLGKSHSERKEARQFPRAAADVGARKQSWAGDPASQSDETISFADFQGERGPWEPHIPSLAEKFYVEVLTRKFKKKETNELLFGAARMGRYSPKQLRLVEKGLVIKEGFEESRFKNCLMTYLIWEMLQTTGFRKEGVELFLSRPRNKFVEKKPRFVLRSHAAENLWDAVRFYTYQYGIESVDELKKWWQAHKSESRRSWAAAQIDPITERKGIPPDRKRQIAFFITRNLSAAVAREWGHFEEWWKKHREKTPLEWQKSLLHEAIKRLDHDNPAVRKRAEHQITCIAGRGIMLQVTDPAEKSAEPDKMARDFRQWWERTKEDYRPKPLSQWAATLWEIYQSKEIHKLGQEDPTRLPSYGNDTGDGSSSKGPKQ